MNYPERKSHRKHIEKRRENKQQPHHNNLAKNGNEQNISTETKYQGE
jgi:hypothetical protein